MNGTEARIIDFHAHVLHPAVYARTINKNVVSGFGARVMEERPAPDSPRWPLFSKMIIPEVQIADMDARGIAHAVIATSTVSQSTFFADGMLAAELDRQANEAIADWVRAYPHRFTGTFTLPLQDMGRALVELHHAVTTLGLRIANLPASVNGKYLGDAYFAPLWAEIETRGLIAIIHPDGIKDPAFQDYSLWNAIGQGIEETRVMASLIYEGVLEPPKGKEPDDWEPRVQTLFRSTAHGDDVDRPVKKSDGSWTYFAPDIAYHYNKVRRGFDALIDIFGATFDTTFTFYPFFG
jgi:predicted TIM-barrel fold metal-dependent hydrolase